MYCRFLIASPCNLRSSVSKSGKRVIKIDGNKAVGRSYWFHYSNDNPKRTGVFDGFGHYEDELIKVKGKWLFTKRKIYNEVHDEWAYKGGSNPAW